MSLCEEGGEEVGAGEIGGRLPCGRWRGAGGRAGIAADLEARRYVSTYLAWRHQQQDLAASSDVMQEG